MTHPSFYTCTLPDRDGYLQIVCFHRIGGFGQTAENQFVAAAVLAKSKSIIAGGGDGAAGGADGGTGIPIADGAQEERVFGVGLQPAENIPIIFAALLDFAADIEPIASVAEARLVGGGIGGAKCVPKKT